MGGGGGGGGAVTGVILVRVCEPVFQNLPYLYTWPLKIKALRVLMVAVSLISISL